MRINPAATTKLSSTNSNRNRSLNSQGLLSAGAKPGLPVDVGPRWILEPELPAPLDPLAVWACPDSEEQRAFFFSFSIRFDRQNKAHEEFSDRARLNLTSLTCWG
jgi:hypothetical protein